MTAELADLREVTAVVAIILMSSPLLAKASCYHQPCDLLPMQESIHTASHILHLAHLNWPRQ